ncbi:F-box domain [Arabidopsis thaliana x Arabidopsis arenosa]|uniref:F-box domain n=1 Tax=Arabidopsis thaliana x Arabidopsis arenosa TaxID=1240361 RepID=A0A8T2B135_9BRAS|nr:F-box domain [Arabidopsis thaliana x Arabidopsis arenosa]
MEMTISELLPKDLVEEILCRVPATSLKRLRSTCKAWNCLFKNDRRFASKHFDKSAKQFLPLLLRTDYMIFPISVKLHGNSPSLVFKSELIEPDSKNSAVRFEITRVFHCDGLLLCSSQIDASRVLVWNPLTGETRWIRTGDFHKEKEGRSYDLGYYHKSSCNKSYKMLSYYRGSKYFEIYDFNSDSWRILDDMIGDVSFGYSELSVSLKGNTYWLARDVNETPRTISLLKFDFSTEKSVPVPLPYQSLQSRRFEASSLSVVGEEKLSVLLQRDRSSKTEIWVTNKIDDTTNAVSWSKVLALDLSPDPQIWYDASFLLEEEKKVVISCDRCERLIGGGDNNNIYLDKAKDMVYIVGEDNVVTQVECGVDEMEGCWPVILNYVPSLVQIKRAGGKRKRGD